MTDDGQQEVKRVFIILRLSVLGDTMSSYDIAIIGAGPGGYVSAIRAAQSGAKAVLIEKDRVGGVCLNHGCIPTKTLIASAHALRAVRNAEKYGVSGACQGAQIDLQKAMERKDAVVSALGNGIQKLLKGNGVEVVTGNAVFTGPKKLVVNGSPIEAKNFLIATGSSWISPPNLNIDGQFVVTSDEALNWTEIPKRLLIVGGGVIGCEFACMMREFGAEVTIIEAMSSILPPVENALLRLLARSMKASGIEILTDTKVQGTKIEGGSVKVALESGEERQVDRVLVAVGRKPQTEGLGLENAQVKTTGRGFIAVDDRFRTSAENCFAIGDCIGNPMLAHAASAEGTACVEGIFGEGSSYDPSLCPSPIFTIPEIASVGATSEELEKKGAQFKTGRFPYAANGKALCDGETDGQAIVHADAGGKILGVHIFGKDATLIIAEAALAMKAGLTIGEISRAIHSHPTLSEILAEAVEDTRGRAIHKSRSIVR